MGFGSYMGGNVQPQTATNLKYVPIEEHTAEMYQAMFWGVRMFLQDFEVFEDLEARECFQRLPGSGEMNFHRM